MNTAEHDRPDEESQIRAALRQVMDPEVGMNIVDLGLVYRIEIASDLVRVEITMTSPACPMGDLILEEAAAVLEKSALAGRRIDVQQVWDPPWTPAMMSETARKHFNG
jgi:metal-sulfur cluster biosynthetic enzyme